MNRTLSLVALAIGLFVAGAVGAWIVLGRTGSPPAEPVEKTDAHGQSVVIPVNAVMCDAHGIPEVACPFCDSSLIESLGHCGGHDVAEALCTRCNPVLIAAFKVEGDWCASHGLPESQCLICQGESQ